MPQQAGNQDSYRTPASTRWERAYQDFETPEEELRKFHARLRSIGASRWDKGSRIVEICSGRGTGLRAWSELGFRNVIGVDYSPALVFVNADGPGERVIGDARALPLASGSVDIAVVQGGLHHLLTMEDLEQALAEMRRIVAPRGRIVIIEPWLTPFLHFVHFVSERKLARRLWKKLDAFETMREEERDTYERWLNGPEQYLALIRRFVTPHIQRMRWGKLVIVGSPAQD